MTMFLDINIPRWVDDALVAVLIVVTALIAVTEAGGSSATKKKTTTTRYPSFESSTNGSAKNSC